MCTTTPTSMAEERELRAAIDLQVRVRVRYGQGRGGGREGGVAAQTVCFDASGRCIKCAQADATAIDLQSVSRSGQGRGGSWRGAGLCLVLVCFALPPIPPRVHPKHGGPCGSTCARLRVRCHACPRGGARVCEALRGTHTRNKTHLPAGPAPPLPSPPSLFAAPSPPPPACSCCPCPASSWATSSRRCPSRYVPRTAHQYCPAPLHAGRRLCPAAFPRGVVWYHV